MGENIFVVIALKGNYIERVFIARKIYKESV
jgi:hypothetical protein